MAPASPNTAELLGRDPHIAYGRAAGELIGGKRVLVTGGGGSIGSEIVRQLHLLAPAAVFRLDHDESALHALSLDLHDHGLFDDEYSVLADIRDRDVIAAVMREIRPDIVFHAAAHKHLPLLERYPMQGVQTNVFGTLNVVSAAVDAGVKRFVNISTDKAASPTSVLGATKRLAEMVVAAHAGRGTRVASVRFGNVLGSRGSFLHSLAHQLDRGVPVTVTDREVTRYFMTIPEAAGLVIEAATLAARGVTYVLDMGAPVRIVELIERYVALSGARMPEILVTGLRPGEKLHEELLDGAEVRKDTPHPRIWNVTARNRVTDELLVDVEMLRSLPGGADMVMAHVSALLPTANQPVPRHRAVSHRRERVVAAVA